VRRAIAVLLLLSALAGLGYFIHGGNQVGIFNGLILNTDAWSDGRHGLALMVAGAFVVLAAMSLMVTLLLFRLGREVRQLQHPEPTSSADAASPRLHSAP
jgi:hypothetical protein